LTLSVLAFAGPPGQVQASNILYASSRLVMETIVAGRSMAVADAPAVFAQMTVAIERLQAAMVHELDEDPAPSYTSAQLEELVAWHRETNRAITQEIDEFKASEVLGRAGDVLDMELQKTRASLRHLSRLAHDLQQPLGWVAGLAGEVRSAASSTRMAANLLASEIMGTHGRQEAKAQLQELAGFFRQVSRNFGHFTEQRSRLELTCDVLEHLVHKHYAGADKLRASLGEPPRPGPHTPMAGEFQEISRSGSAAEKINALVRASVDLARVFADKDQRWAEVQVDLDLKKGLVAQLSADLANSQDHWLRYFLVKADIFPSAFDSVLKTWATPHMVAEMQELLDSFCDAINVEKAKRLVAAEQQTPFEMALPSPQRVDKTDALSVDSWSILDDQ